MKTKFLLNRSGMSPEVTCRKGRHSLDPILSRLCLASLICLCMLTVGVGNAWGATETFDFSSGTATGSGSSRIITWSGTSCTIVQAKGGSGTDVSNSYTGTNLRWYASHDITFTPKSGVTISQITLTGSANDKTGQTMTERTSTSATISAAGRTTTVSGTWTSSSVLTLRMGTQFRLSSVVITYTTGGGSTYSITYVDASGIGTNGRYSASSTSGISSGATITLTATPDDCYQLSSWTAYKTGTPATTVTVTNNQFTMPAYNVTVGATFGAKPAGNTVNFDAGPGVSAASSLTETCSGSGVTLPNVTATGVCKGWTTFAGWATAPVTDSTTTSGVTLYAAGSNYVPASNNMTLYAVYSKNKGGGDGFKLSLNSGGTDYYVGAKGTGSYMSAVTDAADAVVFTFANGYLSYDNSGTKTYISSEGNNTTLTVGTSVPSSTWTESGTTTYTYQSSATGNRYLGFNSGTSPVRFAPYGSSYAHAFTKHSLSTTYYCSDPNCCTELASINGSINSSTPTSVTLQWDKLSNVDGTTPYAVSVSPSAGTSVGGIDLSGAKATCSVTGLTPCTAYTFTINAYGDATHCDKSQDVAHTTAGYTLTVTKNGVTLSSGSEPSNICANVSATYAASTGYSLPSTITVTNAGAQNTGWTWNSGTGVLTINKANVTGNVTVTISGTCVEPEVTADPDDASYEVGDSPDPLEVTATLASGTRTYLWKVSTDNGVNWSNATGTNNLATYNGASLSTASATTLKFKCVVGNSQGGCTVESGVATITINPPSDWKLKGEFDSWGDGYTMTGSGTVSVTRTLPANTRYEFKFYNGATAYGNNGAIVHTVSDWVFATDKGNCVLYTGPAGNYTFSINTSTKEASITYPTVTHPDPNYVYIKKGAGWSDARIYNWDSNSDAKMSDWGGSPVLATCEICGTTYYYGAAYFNKLKFRDGGSNESNNLDLERGKWLDETTHASAWSNFAFYTITFAGNGSDGGSMTDVENICPGDGETIAPNGYTRTGYTFANWKTNVAITANGSPVAANGDVPAGATISSINSNITLTAQWTANTISLTLNKNTEDAGSNNGSGSINYDATSGTITTAPTRTGYTVEGYYTDAACTAANKVLDASGNVINSTVSGYTTSGKWTRATTPTTLYAKWNIATYTVTWHVGDATSTSTVAYNTEFQDISVGKPSVNNNSLSTCESNYFVGWVTSGGIRTTDGGTVSLYNDNKVNATDKITGDVDFYAMFATSSGGGGAAVNTVMYSEDFGGYSAGDVPSGIVTTSSTNRVVYNDGNVTYTSVDGSSNTKVYNENLAEGAASLELLVGKNTGSFTVAGIPNGGASVLTVTYKTNAKSMTVAASGTGYSGSLTASTKEEHSFDVTVGSASTFTLTFTPSTDNVRLDDIKVKVKTQGTSYSNYRTNCAACANTVTVDYDAEQTGCTVAVSKGGTPIADGGTVKTCDGNVNLTVTITPASHFTLTGLTAQISSTDMSQSNVGNVYTVTIPQNQTGTLVLTPTLTEDAHIAINWNVNGVNQSIAATHGKTWVYSGEDLTAIPDDPSVPAGCTGTKVFAGWSQKHSDATEQDAAWYDDLFTAVGGAPTGISSEKTFYAVFATSSANPLAGTVIWDEPFTGASGGDQPTVQTSGATVYNSTVLTYTCNTSYCKIYEETGAGGTSPEILVPKSSRSGSFAVSNIPTAGQTELILTYKTNQSGLSVTSGTSGVTIGDASVDGATCTRTITISQSPSATNNFALTFSMPTDANARLDDIHLVVPGSGTMTDYVTLCAPSYTITYDKNTSDPVTNLPSPTSVLQSTGSGTLSATEPSRATYTFLGWSNTSGSSNTKDYDAGGSITGVTADKTIYAVWEKTAVEEIILNYTSLERYVGDPTETLEVESVVPSGADMSVTWRSDNSSVASVGAATGVVTFGVVGTTTITATSTVTGTTNAVCYVTVRNKPTVTFVDQIHNLDEDKDGTALSTYNIQDVAGTAVTFPDLADQDAGENCEGQHYHFVGWTDADNNTDPEDHLITSYSLINDVNKTFYAVWADGVEGVSYTQLTTNSFKTAPTKYVIGAEYSGDTYYFYSCAATDENNGNGGCTTTPATNAPIEFTLSGTADALVATSTEASARYLKPLTGNNFQMSATTKTIALSEDGDILNASATNWALRFNTSNKYLRWYNTAPGSAAYFYEVVAGGTVSYRTSCCTNNVPAPTVIATNTAYTVTLTWAAVDGATGYEVSWNGGAFEAATSPCVKSGLTASTDYIYKVRATYNDALYCGALVASGSVTTDDVYSVTYSGGTGTGSCSPSGSVAPASHEAGATVTLAPTNSFSLTSNTFAAWVVKDADDNDVAVSNNQFTMPAKNVTVTATWTPVQDKYYDRMHDGTDASHGGVEDGEGKYYLVLEGCNYTVPALTDDDDGDTDCHTTHYKLLGWIAGSHLNAAGQVKTGEESYIFQGGGTKSATGATYYAVWAIMTE